MIERIIKGIVPGFFAVAIACHGMQTFGVDAGVLEKKIAFLKDGEVWICDTNARSLRQITETDGTVDGFHFSPTLEYVAYSKIIDYVDEPGIFEDGEPIPRRARCSIVIRDLEGRKIPEEIPPPEGGWIYTAKWLSDNTLLLYESSGFDVSTFLEYDVRSGTKRELEYGRGSTLIDADIIENNSVMLYVDDTGVGATYTERLHHVDMKTGKDTILVSKRSIMDPTLSCDGRYIAFFEVDHVGGKGIDNVWIYDSRENALKKIYEEPAAAKTAGTSLLIWSPDNRHIGKWTAPATVINIEDPADIRRIPGSDFSWTDGGDLVFSRDSNIYSFILGSGKTALIVENASNPVFLRK